MTRAAVLPYLVTASQADQVHGKLREARLFQWLKTMLTPYQPKTRDTFPAAEGWVKLENSRQSPINLLLEPWGSGFDLKPGEVCYIHLVPDGDHTLLNVKEDDLLVFWSADALYQNNTEVYDFQDE